MNWTGPIELERLLDRPLANSKQRPPTSPGIYVVSTKPWASRGPTSDGSILYVGQGNVLRRRIGQLVAEMLGFTKDKASGGGLLHSGGHHLWHYCLAEETEPTKLFLGWSVVRGCLNCAEAKSARKLGPKLSRATPRCRKHPTKERRSQS
jgi:hypothetical protein